MTSLVFVAPAWRRYAVTRLALAQWAHLRGELAGRGLAFSAVIVADDENLDIARGHGFDTVEQDNTYLGRKVNDGLEYAVAQGADYIVTVGSDDWVHPDLFGDLPREVMREPELTTGRPVVFWNEAPEALTGREMAMVDLRAGRLRRCRARGRNGVIPWVFPRRVLAPSRFYRPVKETALRGIDGSLFSGLRVMPNWIFRDPHDLCRVDFKSGTNITPYDGLVKALGYGPEVVNPWELLATKYPAHLVEMARQTHEGLAQ